MSLSLLEVLTQVGILGRFEASLGKSRKRNVKDGKMDENEPEGQ